MSGKTAYLEAMILNLIYRSQTAWKPAGIYICLFTAAPSDAGGGTEVTGGNYARQQVVQSDANWTIPSGTPRSISNVNEITWANVTWSGTVVAWGVSDSVTGGNLLDWYDCPDQVVASGNTVKFSAGAVVVQED